MLYIFKDKHLRTCTAEWMFMEGERRFKGKMENLVKQEQGLCS